MGEDTAGDRPVKVAGMEGKIVIRPTRRGPKTPAGKARVRLNAVRHGLGVTSPVIPGVERLEDWEAHRTHMLESLAPVGYLETELAERIALTAWRQRRVPAYEIACAQDGDFGTPAEPSPYQLLPAPDEAERIVRYETHLDRLFYKALHELEAQQARRRGQTAPLARVEVHGLPEA